LPTVIISPEEGRRRSRPVAMKAAIVPLTYKQPNAAYEG
jgi:hypothetical protein